MDVGAGGGMTPIIPSRTPYLHQLIITKSIFLVMFAGTDYNAGPNGGTGGGGGGCGPNGGTGSNNVLTQMAQHLRAVMTTFVPLPFYQYHQFLL